MIYEFKNVTPENYISIIQFYAKYGDRSFSWYEKKLKDDLKAAAAQKKADEDKLKEL